MGGNSVASQSEMDRRERERQRLISEARKDATSLATRIVEHINHTVIRPGPKPEERECTHVADELRLEIPTIADLILEE